MDNGSMNEKKQELIKALRDYQQDLADKVFSTKEKDPLTMEIISAIWKVTNLLTGEDDLRKYKAEEEASRKTTPLTFEQRGALAEFKEEADDLGLTLQELLLLRILMKTEKE